MTTKTETLPVPQNARCVGCGYSLYQLTIDRCPECGKAFDPADPESIGLGKSWWRRLFLIGSLFESLHRLSTAPPSPITYLWPWVSVGCFLVAATIPYDFLIARAVGVLILAVFLVGSLIMWTSKFGIASDGRPKNKYPRLASSAWVGVMIACVGWTVCTYVPITAIILFHLYRQDLDALDKRIPPLPVNYRSCDAFQVGPYHPEVGRYLHSLRVTLFETYYPENWEPFDRRHAVEFILRDEPGYDYNKDASWEMEPNAWHLMGNWYASSP